MIGVAWTQKASSAPRPYCPHQPPHHPMLSSLEFNSYLHLSLKISQQNIYKQRWYILISPSSRLWQRHETPRSTRLSTCTIPNAMTHFISPPDSRGTLGVFWESLFTILACTDIAAESHATSGHVWPNTPFIHYSSDYSYRHYRALTPKSHDFLPRYPYPHCAKPLTYPSNAKAVIQAYEEIWSWH
jgi:hypothetical protein